MVMVVVVISTHQVVHGDLVSATESFAVSFALTARQIGMAVFVAIIYIGTTVISVILLCALDPILESLAT